MGQTVLTSLQKKALQYVSAEPNLRTFYLSGGTALTAYYFQHRLSDDLDFFSDQKPDSLMLQQFSNTLKTHLAASVMRFERLYDRNLFYIAAI